MKDEILELIDAGFTYGEAAEKLNISRNIVAGVVWRNNNPGMHKKNLPVKGAKAYYANGGSYGTRPQKAIYKAG